VSLTRGRRAEDRVREVLKRVVSVLESGGDPFTLDVVSLFDELREVLLELEDWGLALDAETVRRIAELIKRQEEWVEGRTSTLSLYPFLALVKLASLQPRELALEFLRAWRPVVSLDVLSLSDLFLGLEYLGTRFKPVRPVLLEEVPVFEDYALESLNLPEVIDEAREELLKTLKDEGRVGYLDFVKGDIIKAYAVSLACSEGEASLEIDPLSGEVYVVPPREGEYESIAIIVKVDEHAET